MSDPIDLPNFHPNLGRPPNPERIKQINILAAKYRQEMDSALDAKEQLEQAILEAKRAGHSFSQLVKASGLSVSSIQRIVAQPKD
jgi:hypothetical protein